MAELKKSEYAESMGFISQNLRICCKIFGTEKTAVIMGISRAALYNKIKSPDSIKIAELLRLSAYTGINLNDFTKSVRLAGRG